MKPVQYEKEGQLKWHRRFVMGDDSDFERANSLQKVVSHIEILSMVRGLVIITNKNVPIL